MNHSIKPGKIWLDTDGKRIEAHGGAIFYENDTFYWYGENKDHTDGKSEIWTWGIRYYSSKDLYNWKDEGFLIEPDLTNRNSLLHPHFRMDRPHILHNFHTGKYVCWLKYSGPEACFALLEADCFCGPYRLVKEHYRPWGKKIGDFDLVQESDGRAVVFFEGNKDGLYQADLTEDYLDVTGEARIWYAGLHAPFTREGPAHFERNGIHYLITSGMSGYTPNPSETAIAKTLRGPYVRQGIPHTNDASRASFNSQISQVFRHPKKKELYIALADRWCPDHLVTAELSLAYETVIAAHFEPEKYTVTPELRELFSHRPDLTDLDTSRSTYVWLPLRFEDDVAYIDWHDEWKLEDYE